jgi:hypothetical protein
MANILNAAVKPLQQRPSVCLDCGAVQQCRHFRIVWRAGWFLRQAQKTFDCSLEAVWVDGTRNMLLAMFQTCD